MKKLLLSGLASVFCIACAVAADPPPPQGPARERHENRESRRQNPMQAIQTELNDAEKGELKKAAEAYLDSQIAVYEKVVARMEKEGKNTELVKKFIENLKENKAARIERMTNPQPPRQAPKSEGRARPQQPPRKR